MFASHPDTSSLILFKKEKATMKVKLLLIFFLAEILIYLFYDKQKRRDRKNKPKIIFDFRFPESGTVRVLPAFPQEFQSTRSVD